MIKFIYFSMAVVAFSFLIVPLFGGIAAERNKIDIRPVQFSDNQVPSQDELSFDEIYALANEESFDPQSLNNIAPAAGNAVAEPSYPNDFSNQVKPQAHPAF